MSRAYDTHPRHLANPGRPFFDSSDPLVPQQANGNRDVYEYEPGRGDDSAETTTFDTRSGGCKSPISSGTAQEPAFLGASEPGDRVFFLSTAKPTLKDIDAGFDVYDAHVCTDASPRSAPQTPPPCLAGPQGLTHPAAADSQRARERHILRALKPITARAGQSETENGRPAKGRAAGQSAEGLPQALRHVKEAPSLRTPSPQEARREEGFREESFRKEASKRGTAVKNRCKAGAATASLIFAFLAANTAAIACYETASADFHLVGEAVDEVGHFMHLEGDRSEPSSSLHEPSRSLHELTRCPEPKHKLSIVSKHRISAAFEREAVACLEGVTQ